MTDRDKLNGVVFNVQRFSLHDGPGIRTLVFLKGCPLRCLWCANPEGILARNQVLYDKRKCRKCGSCMICPADAIYMQDDWFLTDQSKCTGCGECERVCAYGARKMTNKRMTAREVVDLVKRDMMFYGGRGGLTIGGGDPMFQPQFAKEVLALAKSEGVNTAIETSGYGATQYFLALADLADTAHVDLKAFDNDLHKRLTGVSNAPILKNIRQYDSQRAFASGRKMVFRIPLVPGYNDAMENVEQIGKFVLSLRGSYDMELLPFHNFGENKYERLCVPYKLSGLMNMDEISAAPFNEMLTGMGLSVSVNTF